MPDHQEVFVDKDSDMSLIIELLSYDSAVTDDQAASHYFNDLAQCNEVWSRIGWIWERIPTLDSYDIKFVLFIIKREFDEKFFLSLPIFFTFPPIFLGWFDQ